MTGLLASGMLPGVASAAPPGSRKDGSPRFVRTIFCETVRGGNVTIDADGPAGQAQKATAETFTRREAGDAFGVNVNVELIDIIF